MEIPKGTPLKEIVIAGMKFNAPVPFNEGHVLLSNEANVLNQTYHENLRNNFAKAVNDAKEKGTADPKVLQKDFDQYITEYVFGARRGGMFRSTDPVEAEAMRIAKGLIREALKAKGTKLKDVPADDVARLAKDAIAKHPAITKRAEDNVAKERALENDVLGSLADTV